MTNNSWSRAISALAFSVSASAAFAHAQLEKAVPSVGSTVASASEIRLMFSEGVEPHFTGLTLSSQLGRDGAARRACGRPRGQQDPDRQDFQSFAARRLYREMARRFRRHPSYPGKLQLHRQTLTNRRISMSRILTLALLMALGAVSAQAQEFKAGDITVDKAWARATPKGAEVGAGYLTIHNNGATADRITGGSADFAGVQVHEMKTEGGVMKMREVSGGLEIPAHGSVTSRPQRLPYHVRRFEEAAGEGRDGQSDAHLRARRRARGRFPDRRDRRFRRWRGKERRYERYENVTRPGDQPLSKP